MENKAKISVFGAGKMGTGIALQFAVTGFPVKLLAFDVREQQTSAGVIEDNLKLLAENGLVDAGRCDEIRKRIDIVPVSYTHLDVYKRQSSACVRLTCPSPSAPPWKNS